MKQLRSAVPLVFAALVLSGGAQADDREGRGACKSDVQKLCKGVEPGGGRIAACLKQHEAELSAECKKRIAEAREEGREIAQACKGDAQALCKDVQPGQGRVMRCLVDHKDKLSAACQQELAEAESRHPCMKDMERLCKGVQPGGGRIMTCLKQHESQLSQECKAHQASHGER